MKESAKNPGSKLISEVKQFEALGAWCTPEFLMQASQNVKSTQYVGRRLLETTSTVSGQYFASRTLLTGIGQIEKVIEDLRHLLKEKCDSTEDKNRNDLLYMWMSIERCLTEDEHSDLQRAVLDRLFPDYKAPTAHRRDGNAHLGGL